MSFLTAAANAFGGYERGKRDKADRLRQQQQQDQELAIQKEQEHEHEQQFADTEEDRLRNRGIDPATGRPFVVPPELLQVAPNNKGIPLLDPATGKPYEGGASPHQELEHAYKWAQFYSQHGDQTDAQLWLQKAKDIDASMKLDLQALHDKQMYEAAMYGHDVSRENNINTVQGADTRNIRTTDTSRANTFDRDTTSRDNNIRTTDTSRQNAIDRVAQQQSAQVENDVRAMRNQNAIATRTGKTEPYPNLDAAEQNLSRAIGVVASDPKKLNEYLKGLDAHAADYGPEFLIYAKRMLQNAAQGGSQAARPFLGHPPATQPPAYPNP